MSATPAPASEFIRLHEQLIPLYHEEDRAEVKSILWKARTMVSKEPADLSARLLVAKAYLRLGERTEAVNSARIIHGRLMAGAILDVVSSSAAEMLAMLGLTAEAMQVARNLLVAYSNPSPDMAADIAAAALIAGDRGMLQRAWDFVGEDSVSAGIRDVLTQSGMLPYIEGHQAETLGVLRDVLCGARIQLSTGADPGIVIEYRLATDRAGRRRLVDQLTSALSHYYRNVAAGDRPDATSFTASLSTIYTLTCERVA